MSENRRKKLVVLNGQFRVETRVYNKFSGEIVFRADVAYGKVEYTGIPLLRLIIDLMDGGVIDDQGDIAEVYVEDEFFHPIPYLKPVRAFRNALEAELVLLINTNPSPVIKAGAEEYLEEIRTFSELKGLVRQAKTCVNALKPERKGAERMARAIMEAMNVMPTTDTEFRME